MKRLCSLGFVIVLILSGLFISHGLDDYPENLKNKPIDEVIDPWSFYNRECTSFVAWCLNSRNGVDFNNFYKGVQWGNAVDWVDAARSVGVRVDKIPAVGAVAWRGDGYGHVSYVVDITTDGVHVEEYNAFKPGSYGERFIALRHVDQFIHFGGTDDFMKNQVTWAKNVYYKRDDYYKGSYTGRWKNARPMGEGLIIFDGDSKMYRERGALKYKGEFEDGYPSGKGTMHYEDRTENGTYFGAPEVGKTLFEGSEDYHSGVLKGFMHTFKLRLKDNNKPEYYDELWYRHYMLVDMTTAEAEAMKKDKSLFEKKFGKEDEYGSDYGYEARDAGAGEEEQDYQVGADRGLEDGEQVSTSIEEGEDEALRPSPGYDSRVQEAGTVNEQGFTKSKTYQRGQFSDVTETDWFESWVGRAVEYGLVQGGSNGSFSPMGDISYAELITIAARMHSIYYNNPIQDRSWGEWYQKYFDYAREQGIIDDNYLDSDRMKEKANRSDSVGILGRALPQRALVSKNQVADSAIPDVKMGDANSSPIYTFYRAGILSGSDATGRFHPLKSITRAEISKIIVCMVDENSRKSFELLATAN